MASALTNPLQFRLVYHVSLACFWAKLQLKKSEGKLCKINVGIAWQEFSVKSNNGLKYFECSHRCREYTAAEQICPWGKPVKFSIKSRY
jgi:hypothetical protein